jgi:CBS domain-containing protein
MQDITLLLQKPPAKSNAGRAGAMHTVQEVMTNRVIRVCEESKVGDGLRLMMAQHADEMVVVDDSNAVIGIVTCADILRKARRQQMPAVDFLLTAFVYYEEDDEVEERVRKLFETPIAKICTRDVITCTPTDEVADVAGVMVDHRIKRIPVVNEYGSLVGIISRDDVLRAIWQTYTAME